MVRKLSLICVVAVALLLPIQTFAAHASGLRGWHGSPGWHAGPGWAGWHVGPGWGGPDGAIPDGMAVPDGAGTGGVVAGGEVIE